LGRVLFVFAKANPPQKTKRPRCPLLSFCHHMPPFKRNVVETKRISITIAHAATQKQRPQKTIQQSSFFNHRLSIIIYNLIHIFGQVLPNCQKTTIGKGIEKDTL